MREVICSEIPKDQPAQLPIEWSGESRVAAGIPNLENIRQASEQMPSRSQHLNHPSDRFDEEAD